MRASVGREALRPLLFQLRAAGPRVPRGGDGVRDHEGREVPIERRARGGDFLLAQRCAVSIGGPRLVGRALADHRLAADELRPARSRAVRLGRRDRGVHGLHVVAVDVRLHVPAVRLETPRGIVGEPALGLPVDRDAVVVVEHDQLAETPRACKRAGLVRYAFHQAAIAHERISSVVDDLVPCAVEARGDQPLRERHPDGVREALSQRTGGGLDTRCHAVFGMSGGFRVQLPEMAQLVDRQVVAREVEQAVEQHRAVAVREHETVAVGPRRMRRMMAQVPVPERERDFGHPHRHSRMSALRGLDRVHGQRAERIGQRFVCYGGGRGS